MAMLLNIFKSIFGFLSSLKLAVIVILSLAFVLALGTIQESLYGIAVARDKVYGTWWFTLVLFFLGLNVLCAALSRLPWKRHHIGFVVTHAGIITILIGSVVTQRFGIDGSLPLAEGEEADRITLDEPLLQVVEPDQKSVMTWKVRFSQRPPKEEKPWKKSLKDGSQVIVDRFFLHSQASLNFTNENPDSNPALQVVLTGLPMGGDQDLSQWLFQKESEFGSSIVQLGPAKIAFLEEAELKNLSEGSSKGAQKKIGILKFQWGGGNSAEVDVEKALKEEVVLPGSVFRLRVLRYFPDARVVDNQLVTRGEEPHNPALEFKIMGPDAEETHVVFANFPELEGVHGAKKSRYGLKSVFVSAAQGVSQAKGELFLSLKSPEEILYRIRAQGKLSPLRSAKIGEEIPTGWMTIRFKVAEYLPKAQTNVSYRKVVVPPGKSGPPPAIHLKVEKDGKFADAWLQQGDVKEMVLSGVPYLIRYGLRAHPLGFFIRLKKFDLDRYAGTNNPSSFASDVEIKNSKAGESFETRISMNEPLDYQGYKFYQASYQEGEGGAPDISIFSVGKDPGTPIKYAGSILLVGGIALMFWFKPLFVQKRAAAKKREKIEESGTGQPAPLQSKL